MNLEKIRKLVKDKYINKQKHPTADLWIYNYTALTQYEGLWNEHTLQCRGLIVDQDNKVVSRPFRKFFNLQEVESVPSGDYIIREKLDGSLGISYILNGKVYLATRGSFNSDQAIKGSELLQNYPKTVEYILNNPHLTLLFEIIYPTNRIVVDYGDEEKLVLTGVIHTQYGTNYTVDSVPNLDIEYPRVFDGDLENLSEFENKKDEGFVVEFTNGGNIVLDRIKYKLSEYVRLHKIITECSTYSIFEAYKMDSIAELLEKVPDEFYDWVKLEVERIKTDYDTKELNAKNILSSIQGLSRKDQAITLQKTEGYLPIVFAMIDGKDYREVIYKQIKPEYRLFKETL